MKFGYRGVLAQVVVFGLLTASGGAGLFAGMAQAADSETEKYFTIEAVKLTLLESSEEVEPSWVGINPPGVNTPSPMPVPSPSGSGITGPSILDEFINLGKQAWQIVVENRPVANFRQSSASVVPKGIQDWQELQGWQAPRSQTYRLSFSNGFGSDVVRFDYRILYTHGGNVKGKGRYLANVTIVPASLEVSWGFTFNADVAIPSITNAGTHADPIAAAELQVHWSADSVLKHLEGTDNFYIRGDGTLQSL
ncbi:MAG: hypothetical protein NDJ89_08880 [Oligoflexia bacterium]|nr:hypothetical protein [Oligoflexia bacterium]